MLSRRLLRIKVVKSLYAHIQGDVDKIEVSLKNLRYSVDKAYELYFQMLWLIVEVRRYAAQRIEIGRNKQLPTPEELNPNTKFVDNRLIDQIEQSEVIGDFIQKHRLGWTAYPELIRDLYNAMVESPYYQKYMATETRTFKSDVALVKAFYMSEAVEDSELLESVLEEQSIMWNDDLGSALIMVVRTLEDCRASQEDIPVLPQFKNEEDWNFAKTLFSRSARNYDENLATVERFIVNWDVERIALMDNLIMTTALTELKEFEEIPSKVTLDEYIEISKYYSSPGSNQFINGVLDRLTSQLTADGVIVKTGRGLK
ncbi:MAG: transcription antitermination protein NusB [Rikenellaceae bacterium]|nr:transcription antitermination protein NusB [Rikenellaceae bacterium]